MHKGREQQANDRKAHLQQQLVPESYQDPNYTKDPLVDTKTMLADVSTFSLSGKSTISS
jgi:hypothetical protein